MKRLDTEWMLQVCDRLHTALDGSGEVAATDHSFLPLLEITDPKSHEVSSCFRWCKLPVKGWLSTQMHTVPRVDNGWIAKLYPRTLIGNFYPVLLTAFDFTTWDSDFCNLI